MKIENHFYNLGNAPTRIFDDRRSSNTLRTESGAKVSLSPLAQRIDAARHEPQADVIREDRVLTARIAMLNGSLTSERSINRAIERLVPDLFE